MKTIKWGVAVAVFFIACTAVSYATEHGGREHAGKEHAGKEHGGQAMKADPSAEDIRAAIRQHVEKTISKDGVYEIADAVTGKTRRLEFMRVHERVGKTGSYYYSCADFRDKDTNEALDLDFDVEAGSGALNVVDARIHKVEGKERYTYDERDNRIPVAQ